MSVAGINEALRNEAKWAAVWVRQNRENKQIAREEEKAKAKAEGREVPRKPRRKKPEYVSLGRTGIDPWFNGAEPAKVTDCVPITDGSVLPMPHPGTKDYGSNYIFACTPTYSKTACWVGNMSYKKVPQTQDYDLYHTKKNEQDALASAGAAVLEGAARGRTPAMSGRSKSSPALAASQAGSQPGTPSSSKAPQQGRRNGMVTNYHCTGERLMCWPQDLPI